MKLSVLSCSLAMALGGFSAFNSPKAPTAAARLDIAAPPRAAPKRAEAEQLADLTPPPAWGSRPPRVPNEFELNQGRAIDTLRHDYPRLFDDKPDYSIFAQNVELHDPSGKRLQGVAQYEKVFDMLRFLRRTTMQDAEVTYRLVVHESSIRVRWSAKMFMRDPVMGLTQLNIIDGVSVYDLDSVGKIRAHRLENIIMTDREQGQPVTLGFLWPTPQMAMPEMAVPFFKTLHSAAGVPAAPLSLMPLRADRATARRNPAPQAMADGGFEGETPMQRAERERAEDAEKARRLAELRTQKQEQQQGGGLGGIFGMSGPQQCETSFDCDAPMVCCDLLVASVCCSGGMMIPKRGPEASLQRQAIPIPVEKDSPFPPGVNVPTPGQYPGSF